MWNGINKFVNLNKYLEIKLMDDFNIDDILYQFKKYLGYYYFNLLLVVNIE